MRLATLISTVRAIYPLNVGRLVLLAITIIYVSNSNAMIVLAQQPLAEAAGPARVQALLALEDIYGESKGYDDLGLRARVKAHLADVLWAVDASRAKDMLAAAFDDTSG
jgi:hypothetical protein